MLALAPLVFACAALAQDPPAEAPADPVTGVWKGLARDEGPILPEAGVPVSLWLRHGDARVEGRISLQGFEVQTAEGGFQPDTGELRLATRFQGIPVAIELTLSGEELDGSFSGMGMTVTLEARRVSRDVLEEPPAPSAPVDVETLDDEAWAGDLEFLAAYLPQVHANAFHTLSAEEWRIAVEELARRLPELDGLETTIALAQLVARVGDAHTGLGWRELPGFASFPIRLRLLADGLFVTEVDERWADALGRRIVRIGEKGAAEAMAAVCTTFAAENDSWRRAQAPSLLVVPELLAILGVIDSAETLPIAVELEPGSELPLELERTGEGSWLLAPDPEYDPVARWQTRRGERYWFEVIDVEGEGRTVYFAYQSCAEDPARPMAGFVDEVLEAVELSGAERLVFDLRNNSGGNSLVLSQHIERVAAHPRLSEPGRILALIGPVTYSSGMMNAHQLRTWAGATLVGEPTGGKPNSYGEVRSFRLPASGLAVHYSTKYFRMLDTDPPALEPDVLVELGSADYFAGRDVVLEAASRMIRASNSSSPSPKDEERHR